MKALILVGGYGTRLRPLTLSVPKPLIHFCNRPMVEYQIRALVEVGVKHVILAVAYQPDAMRDALQKLEKRYNIRISCSVEEEPLQTAGPIRLAQDLLNQDDEGESDPELFFCFNSDIICEFPLRALVNFHKSHGHEGTLCVTKVQDPSPYGVVLYDSQTHCVDKFVEKPKDWVGDRINAGLYLLNRSVIQRIEPRPTSLEREVFPEMANDRELYAFNLNGYWADIGKPKDFLDGTRLYLAALAAAEKENRGDGGTKPLLAAQGPGIQGAVLIHPSATIGEKCLLGPDVTIGKNVVLGDGVRLSNTAVMPDVKIGSFTKIADSIIGWSSKIGRWSRIEGLTVLGQDVSVDNDVALNGVFVLPYKRIAESVHTPGKIIM